MQFGGVGASPLLFHCGPPTVIKNEFIFNIFKNVLQGVDVNTVYCVLTHRHENVSLHRRLW